MQHIIEQLHLLLYKCGGASQAYAVATGNIKVLLSRICCVDDEASRFTIVFDEAQNLSWAAIEALRFWNDRDRCYAPHPIGLVFVGNAEFALAGTPGGETTISAAVASRALYKVELDRDDLTGADYGLVLEAHGVTDADARHAVIQRLTKGKAARDLRSLVRLIDELRDDAGDVPITIANVHSVLSIA